MFNPEPMWGKKYPGMVAHLLNPCAGEQQQEDSGVSWPTRLPESVSLGY